MREKNRHGGENRSGEIRWDFSVNINPLGMPEAAKAALLSGWNVFENYPDDGCAAAASLISRRDEKRSPSITQRKTAVSSS